MILSDEQKTLLIDAGIRAPSADNSQPWKYQWENESQVSIWRDPALSGMATDKTFILTDLAIGCVIESIRLKAIECQLNAKVVYCPNEETDKIATLTFSSYENKDPEGLADNVNKESARDRELAPYLDRRCTDRRFPYKGPVTDNDSAALCEVVNDGNYAVNVYTDKRDIARFLPSIKEAEQIRFECENLHQELFQTIVFDHTAPEKGMTPAMLSIEPIARPMFRLMSTWRTMQKLNKIGTSKMIAMRSVTLPFKLSPAMCALTAKGTSRTDILKAGQQMMRFWLKATQLGLSVHPYAAPGVLPLAKPDIAESYLARLEQVKNTVDSEVGNGQQVIMFFRIGRCSGTPTTSLRRSAHSLNK